MSKPAHSPQLVYWATALNGAVMIVLFVFLALNRNVDGDEGLYLEVARLVGQGKRLYSDFFYQQMPLIPYFYAAWAKLFGLSLLPARILSALLSAGAGIFALFYVARSTKNLFLVNAAAILLYANGLFLSWAPVIKTHPFNAFFLTSSCVLVLLWRRAEARKWQALLWAGILLGLGVNCRLTLAPFPLLYLPFIAVADSSRVWRNWAYFALGLVLASVPSLYFLGASPDLFLKYNLIFHTRIFPGIAADDFRWEIASKVLLEPQFLALLVAFYAGLILQSLKGWKVLALSDAFFIWMLVSAYFVIHLSAATPFTQYFCTVVPLLVIGVVPLLQWTMAWNSALRTLVLAPLFILYAIAASQAIWREMHSVGTLNPVWRVSNVNAATDAIRHWAKPGEPCLTWWPGYAVLGGCASVPGMENHMREHAILRGIGPKLLNDYKMLSSEGVIDLLRAGKYRVVIDGAYRLDTPYKEYTDYILQENYRLKMNRGLAKIYVRRGAGDRLGEAYAEVMDESLEEFDEVERRYSREKAKGRMRPEHAPD